MKGRTIPRVTVSHWSPLNKAFRSPTVLSVNQVMPRLKLGGVVHFRVLRWDHLILMVINPPSIRKWLQRWSSLVELIIKWQLHVYFPRLWGFRAVFMYVAACCYFCDFSVK